MTRGACKKALILHISHLVSNVTQLPCRLPPQRTLFGTSYKKFEWEMVADTWLTIYYWRRLELLLICFVKVF